MQDRENIPEREQNVQGLGPRENAVYSGSCVQVHVAGVEKELILEPREHGAPGAAQGAQLICGLGWIDRAEGRGLSDRGFCLPTGQRRKKPVDAERWKGPGSLPCLI